MNAATLLKELRPPARRFGNDRRWAEACGLPPQALSRLGKSESCDLRTLSAAVGLQAVGDG